MKKVFFITVVVAICFSCVQQEKQINIKGISVTCPAGWKVTDVEEDDDNASFSIEKKGISASATITIAITQIDVDPEDLLVEFQEEVDKKSDIKNFVLQEPYIDKYGNYKALLAPCTFDVSGQKAEGIIYVLYDRGVTLLIVEEWFTKDRNANVEGVKSIRESLVITNPSYSELGTRVDLDNFSFTCPAEWKYVEIEEYMELEEFSCVEIQKKGIGSSGYVSIISIDAEVDLLGFIGMHAEYFFDEEDTDEEIFETLVFKDAETAKYGKYDGITLPYTFKSSSVKFEGKISAFFEGGVSVLVLQQGAITQRDENSDGFKAIEKSFKIE